jgi:hypothetical protein
MRCDAMVEVGALEEEVGGDGVNPQVVFRPFALSPPSVAGRGPGWVQRAACEPVPPSGPVPSSRSRELADQMRTADR